MVCKKKKYIYKFIPDLSLGWYYLSISGGGTCRLLIPPPPLFRFFGGILEFFLFVSHELGWKRDPCEAVSCFLFTFRIQPAATVMAVIARIRVPESCLGLYRYTLITLFIALRASECLDVLAHQLTPRESVLLRQTHLTATALAFRLVFPAILRRIFLGYFVLGTDHRHHTGLVIFTSLTFKLDRQSSRSD